jgi:hypothetical protein
MSRAGGDDTDDASMVGAPSAADADQADPTDLGVILTTIVTQRLRGAPDPPSPG